MNSGARVHRGLHLLAGGGLILAGGVAGWKAGPPFQAGLPQAGLIVAGAVLLGLGFRRPAGRLARGSALVSLALLTLFLLAALGEVLFRAIGFDFAREEEKWRRTPPFFRQPTVATGAVFFRRPGPETWTGQVLHTRLQQIRLKPNPYQDEPVVTVHYDRNGFRNEHGPAEWDLVVAGDSFTEMGYLPYDQLFTTRLGRLLPARVLNLGASYTGPLTHLSYLEEYGVSPATRGAVIAFFEGNDLADLNDEWTALAQFRETGQRRYREFQKRTSLLKAMYRLLRSLLNPQPVAPEPLVAGWFKSRHGDVPVSLHYLPPNRSELSPDTLRQLEFFLERYAAFGRERGIQAWLAFMPCKERVVHGRVAFSLRAPQTLKDWKPSDLPELMAELAARHGVQFVDLTTALTAETREQGGLLYNSIYDTHLNARGSEVVARELARRLETFGVAPAR